MKENQKKSIGMSNLERIGVELGYEVFRNINLKRFLSLPIHGNMYLDLVFFRDKKLKVVVEVEVERNKKVVEAHMKKFKILRKFFDCKCIVLSTYVAETLTQEGFRTLLEKINKPTYISKRNLSKFLPIRLYKILKFIEANPNTHLRAIAREMNLHPQIVKRCLSEVEEFLDFTSFNTPEIQLPNLPTLIRIKEGYTVEKIINSLSRKPSLKRKIKQTSITFTKPREKVKNELMDRKTQTWRIVKFIELNPNTYLREISRELNINPAIVHRVLKEINEFLVVETLNGKVGVDLPNLPTLLRLKEGITTEGILRFLKIKEKIRS